MTAHQTDKKSLPAGAVNLSLLAHHVGEAAADTLDRAQGVLDALGTVNVGVEDTQDVLEVWGDDEGLV